MLDRCIDHSLDTITIGVDDKGGVVVLSVLWTQAGRPVVLPTMLQSRGVETRYRDVTAVPGQSYDYVVAKTNAAGTGPDSPQLTVAMPTPAAPSITSAGSAYANTGVEFRYRVAASNDPIGFAVNGLPDGLSLDRKTGVISGTPLRTGATLTSATVSEIDLLSVGTPSLTTTLKL